MNATTQRPKATDGSHRRCHTGEPTGPHARRTPPRTQRRRPWVLQRVLKHLPAAAVDVLLLLLLLR